MSRRTFYQPIEHAGLPLGRSPAGAADRACVPFDGTAWSRGRAGLSLDLTTASAIRCTWRHAQGGANVLLRDKPTNDLDVNTLRALEDALKQFAGCVVVISHDRWFLDRIATHILAFEGESKATFFDGNFSEYEDWRRKTLDEEASRPHRMTYRKLTR